MISLQGPNFVIAGAQRCGTSSLYKYLCSHNQILPAKKKEIHYFDTNLDKGKKWYNSHFPSALKRVEQMILRGKRILTGEASPYYIFHPHAVERIAEYNKNIKIIIMLRNPTERAWSHFKFGKARHYENLTFTEALIAEKKRTEDDFKKMLNDKNFNSVDYQRYSYLKRGRYIEQIKEIFKYFDKKNILIIKSEDFFNNTQKIMDTVCSFLGIENMKGDYKVINKTEHKKIIDFKIKRYLDNYYRPYNKKLYDYLKVNFDW